MSSPTEIPAGLADVPVAKSAISIIDGKRALLSYRGIPVETLAKESSYEETSWLLLKGELPTQRQLADFHHELRQRRSLHYKLIDVIKNFPPTGHPMDSLQSTVAALAMFYPAHDVSNAASNWEATLRLIASLPTLVAAFARLRVARRRSIRIPTLTTLPTSTTCCSAASRRRRYARLSMRA